MSSHKYGTIAEERPDLIEFLLEKSDANKYYIGSAFKVDWVCPNCRAIIKSKSINKVVMRGVPCPVCRDGISKPEKIIASALRQIGLKYECQKTFKWSGNKRYDFYLSEYNSIIEVHGTQHYGYGFQGISGVSYEKQMKTDKEKYILALNNGVENYIIINASNTSAEYIIPQLTEHLKRIGINAEVSVETCEIDSLKSNVVEAAKLWNDGLWTGRISETLGISNHTVIDYLKTATTIGMCDYSPKKARELSQGMAVESRRKSVRCITTGKIFHSISEACREYGISSASNIIRSCTNKDRFAGKYNNIPLKWEYY